MWRATVLLLSLLTLLSCSRSTRHKMLGVLFDDPPTSEKATVVDSLVPPPAATAEAGAASQLVVEVLHSPYEDKDCESCHAIAYPKPGKKKGAIPASSATGDRSGLRLIVPASQLCFECHDDMTVEAFEADDKTVHYPVEEGECLECHDPHKSEFASLLRRAKPIESLCFTCHESDDILTSDQHGDMTPEERNCVECHDPHASKDEYLLK
jgi:predicted CXXCH cytochrome family protein